MSDPIYTVTSCTKDHDSRCWGWYPTLADAEEAVAQNIGGMDDCLYGWLVIERVPQSVLAMGETVAWFEWDVRTEMWNRWSSPPPWTVGTVNWGMG